ERRDGSVSDLFDYLTPGAFLYIDLLAAFTNALNGALLAQRPDHYKGRYITVVGILVFAVFGGIGGGITRDVLLNDQPGSLTNPWYLILIFVAWVIGMRTAWTKGQQFRETYYQFMTSFSLPWYAIVGVQLGLEAGWPLLGAIFLGVVGPTAGRFLIDVGSGVPAKQFVQGEWFIGTAILTSLSFFFLRVGAYGGFGLSLGFVAATLVAFAIGFTFRVAAIWYAWEEPMPKKIPAWLLKGQPKRETLKEKMQPGWTPSWEQPEE
ncbi:MAG: TRIC cation channel family protein, partial [Acidimicrobiia bacterium]|nr:TRIC cation channel family protein [Acidimicrobiia bacterium]